MCWGLILRRVSRSDVMEVDTWTVSGIAWRLVGST
jgi:hypothetical protein